VVAVAKKSVKKVKSAKSKKVAKKAVNKTAGKTVTASKVKPAVAKTKAKATAAVSASPRLKKSPLSKSELDMFKKMLVEKRRALVGDMNGIAAEALRTNRHEGSGDLSSMPTHPADVGSDNYEHEFALGLLESERTLLKEIDAALERVANGTFGICLGTGKPISVARLKARPWAKYCIEYATLLEKGLAKPPVPAIDESSDEEYDEEEEESDEIGEEEEEAPENSEAEPEEEE